MPHNASEAEKLPSGTIDLGPLTWVLNDLRQSIPMAVMGIRHASRESESPARVGEGWHEEDSLRSAQHQFEQAAGALAIVGHPEASKVFTATQAAIEVFLQKPATCTDHAVGCIDRASQAVINFLQARLNGHAYSPVALFPSFREVLRISGSPRPHPADLWPSIWRWQVLARDSASDAATPTSADTASDLDSAFLGCIRSSDPASAQALTQACSAMAHRSSDEWGHTYWLIAAGFFEAVSLKLLPHTIELKRTMADIRGALMRHPLEKSDLEGHAREMLFFCACARPRPDLQTPHLYAVRQAYKLDQTSEMDYETDIFGQRDPEKWAALHQKLGVLIDGWAAVAGGQTAELHKTMVHLTGLIATSSQVVPVSTELLQELLGYLTTLNQSAQMPSGTMTMEVAIALLTLEAACDDPYAAGDQLGHRCQQLTHRLSQARQSANTEPLDDWMLAVFHHGARQRSMTSLVSELRKVLQDIEACLERNFANSRDSRPLAHALENLEQADGIFAMLGLEQAHLATQQLREQISEAYHRTIPLVDTPLATQARWASNLGALVILTDALVFQPALAKELFYFDAAAGKLLSGVLPAQPQPEAEPEPDPEIMAIFLGEVRQILTHAEQAIAQAIARGEADVQAEDIRTIRRTFHTLKGSARMVGLDEFGEAAWAFEQLCTAYIAQEHDLDHRVLTLSHQALLCLREWLDAVEGEYPVTWHASQFRVSADALRVSGAMHPLRSDPVAQPAARADKQIGPLRLSENLFLVFTTEAADRIAQLGQLVTPAIPGVQPDIEGLQSIQNLLHALHGSAATVGFTGLAAIAQAAEHGLKRATPKGTAQWLKVAQATVPEMERLLQRFVEGHLDDAPLDLLNAMLLPAPVPAEPPPPPSPSPPQLTQAHDDTLDLDLWPTFHEEGSELLPELDRALRMWAAHTGNTTHADAVRRLLHTLKGSARSAGATQLGEMAHGLETYLSAKPDEMEAATWLSNALEYVDTMRAHFDGLQQAVVAGSAPSHVPQAQRSENEALPSTRPTVRVGAEHLDRVLSQCSDVLVVGARMQSRAGEMLSTLEQLSANASRLREQLRALEMQTELQMQSRNRTVGADKTTLDPLELDRFTQLQEVSRMMAESTEDLGTLNKSLREGMIELDRDLSLQKRQGNALQQEILGMRLVAFDKVADRLYAVVRQAAKHAGRNVRLDILGSATGVDRSMLERLAPCLEHLVRNAVVHGIEAPSERVAAGKPATGEICVSVKQEGQHIHIDVRDDGAGLRKDRIRSKAIGQGLITHETQLSDDEAIAILMQSGFSTSEDINMFAGRGVGMDVVQSEVRGMGGQMTVQTTPGQGLCFAMVFPVTTGLSQVVLFRVGDMTFGVPRAMLLQVLQRPLLQVPRAATTVHLPDHGDVDLFWAGDLLEGPDPDPPEMKDSETIAVFGSPGEIVALQVTQFLGEREMAAKALGPQFTKLPALVAAAAMPAGDLILIYNPMALARTYGNPARQRHLARLARADQKQDDAAHSPLTSLVESIILVVDDSITVRRVTQRLLTREGMQVVLANNGLDALDKLKTIRPDLILSDIEMPHMDGFDLARAVRADPTRADVPFVIISSRVGDKHRDIAQTLGVNHYLGKPYSEPALMELVRRYCSEKRRA